MKWNIENGRRLVARNKGPIEKEELIEAAESYHDRGWWVAVFDEYGKELIHRWEYEKPTKYRISDAILKNESSMICIVHNQSNLWVLGDGGYANYIDLSKILSYLDVDLTPTWQDAFGIHRLFRSPFDTGNPTNASFIPPSGRGFWLPGLSPDDIEVADLPQEYIKDSIDVAIKKVESIKLSGYKF